MDNSYREFEDPAITVKFKIVSEDSFDGAYVLAWTTTPWTIPANRALVVDQDEEYVLVESLGERYIVGKPRVEVVFEGIKHKITKTFKGKELLGKEYKPAFDFYKSKETEFKIYHFNNMANMEDGTGIVHSAPGFGEIDTEMGRHYDLSIMLNINDEGMFLAGNNGNNPYEGMFYMKANPSITKDLKEKGLIFKDEKIVHRIPYHDRCDTNLVQKAQNSWFVNIKNIKNKLISNNEEINWIPDYLKYKRFKSNIEQAQDWCI
jgi:isoleucyl-tRNA synthetase